MKNTILINELRDLSKQAKNYMDTLYYLLLMSLLESETYDRALKKRILSVVSSMTTSYDVGQRRGFV